MIGNLYTNLCFCQSNQKLCSSHKIIPSFCYLKRNVLDVYWIWISWKLYCLSAGSGFGCTGLGTVHYRTAISRLGLLSHATLLAQSLQSHQHNGWSHRSERWGISFVVVVVFKFYLYFCVIFASTGIFLIRGQAPKLHRHLLLGAKH